ncbi:MAG: ammonia channel protein, partial [Propionibacteriaceae bacterium]
AVGLKYRLGFDDSLDVVGVHLVGGLWGTVSIGFLATADAPAGVDGLFYGGGAGQLGKQVLAAVVVMVFSFVVTGIIGIVLQKTMGFRIDEEDEITGIDTVEHAESGYDWGTLTAGGGRVVGSPATSSDARHTASGSSEVSA